MLQWKEKRCMTTKYKYTHKGVIVGANSCAKPDYQTKVYLRGTKTLWITVNGGRYRKSDGYPPGERWPTYVLDLDSIESKE
jgi:hypothetical protein